MSCAYSITSSSFVPAAVEIHQRNQPAGRVLEDMMECRAELALVYLMEDKVEEAKSLYLQMFPDWGMSINHDLAMMLLRLGFLCHEKKDYIQTKQMYQYALSFIEKYIGPKDYLMGICLYNLARIFHAQGSLQQADILYQKALPILFQTVGQNDHDTIMCLENYRDLMKKKGQSNNRTKKMSRKKRKNTNRENK
jgi:tetratricopeptide (TPR) repeat protein